MADEKKPAKKQRTWVKTPLALVRSTLSAEEIRVVILLLARCNPKRDEGRFECWLGTVALAGECACSERHVRRLLSSLREKRLISYERNHGGKRIISILFRCEGMEEGLPDDDE